MRQDRTAWLTIMAALTLAGCGDAAREAATRITEPSLAAGGVGRPTVLVNPRVRGNGTASTIQEGIDMVADGGRVLVMPGTYNERIVIDKGLTLEPVAGSAVVIEQVLSAPAPSGLVDVVRVATSRPVVIRGIEVHHVNLRGLNAFTAVDLTVDEVSFRGEFPPPAIPLNNGVSVVNNAVQSGGRARVVVRASRFAVDGNAVAIGGDVDALIEGNAFRHQASNAGCIGINPTGQGVTVPAGQATNVLVLRNEFDDCGGTMPRKAANAINVVGVVGATTTGTVDIVGNTFRNGARSALSCNTGGILYEFYRGRIERNSFVGVVQDCASVTPAPRNRPGAVVVGSLVPGIRAADVVVRFNDFEGNAHAGLRIGPNQAAAAPIDATCNWWGDASGPSGPGQPGSGDAIIVEPGATPPRSTPFAQRPIAASLETTCSGGG